MAWIVFGSVCWCLSRLQFFFHWTVVIRQTFWASMEASQSKTVFIKASQGYKCVLFHGFSPWNEEFPVICFMLFFIMYVFVCICMYLSLADIYDPAVPSCSGKPKQVILKEEVLEMTYVKRQLDTRKKGFPPKNTKKNTSGICYILKSSN